MGAVKVCPDVCSLLANNVLTQKCLCFFKQRHGIHSILAVIVKGIQVKFVLQGACSIKLVHYSYDTIIIILFVFLLLLVLPSFTVTAVCAAITLL